MKNIELKAKYTSLNKAEELAKKLDADFQWKKKQVDTYFCVCNGRLKLRETEDGIPELISYFRENKAETRESNYQITKIPNGLLFKKMLEETLGILTTVSKIRKLYLYQNVRIHLDQVEKLGNYLEFEGVITNQQEINPTKKKVGFLTDHFKMKTEDFVKYSYSDLLLDQSLTS
jgi:predicted adenylyl cyclase CyaB